MNKERLIMLKDMLLRHDEIFPKLRFDIAAWSRDTKGEFGVNEDGSCGTAACALGSACFYKPFIEQGLVMNALGLPEYQNNLHYNAGAEFFGLTNKQALYLFGPYEYNSEIKINKGTNWWDEENMAKVTPQMVVKHIDKVLTGAYNG